MSTIQYIKCCYSVSSGGARTSRQPGHFQVRTVVLLRTLRRPESENFSQPGRKPGQKLFSQGIWPGTPWCSAATECQHCLCQNGPKNKRVCTVPPRRAYTENCRQIHTPVQTCFRLEMRCFQERSIVSSSKNSVNTKSKKANQVRQQDTKSPYGVHWMERASTL